MDESGAAGEAAERYVLRLAQAKAAHGAGGQELAELLRHASELLDLVDEALLGIDQKMHRKIFLAVPTLRAKLDAVRERACGGPPH